MNYINSRRSFLKAVGATAVALPFFRLLESSASATPVKPLRFVAFFAPHGFNSEYWTPRGTETNFDINFENSMMQPLHRHKSKLLILDGLDYKVLYEYQKSGHEGAPVSALTGSRLNESSGTELPESISLDQAIANKVGNLTKFRSLEALAYQEFPGQHVYNSISFGANGTRIPFERDPGKVYDRFFSVDTGSEEARKKLAKKKSLVSYLNKQTTSMQGRLAGPEKQKLDAHLSALADIERRLNSLGGSCEKPDKPPSYNIATLGQIKNAPTLLKLHLDLIAQAFACDLTRVASMPIGVGPQMPFIGLNKSIHDDIAHQVDTNDPAARLAVRLELVKVQQWYAEQIAYFMDKLASIPEGDGTVLDNTIILWMNELGDPSGHGCIGVPTVIAGGAGGKFRMGRYVHLRPGVTNPLQGWSGFGQKAPKCVAHNKLLVSIANAFDIETDTFGHPDYVGGLSGLT